MSNLVQYEGTLAGLFRLEKQSHQSFKHPYKWKTRMEKIACKNIIYARITASCLYVCILKITS